MTGSKKTESTWAERVQAWRASGETAEEFAARHGFAPTKLRWWSSRVSRAEVPTATFLRVVGKTAAPAPQAPADIVVEVGGARVRVRPGFDPNLLADLVRALSAGVP